MSTTLLNNQMKYYAVKIGRKPGIYTDWEECKKHVLGVKAVYKSFKTKEEALSFIGEEKLSDNFTQVYFDGGCKNEVAGGACVVDETVYYQKVAGFGTNNRGELTGLILALTYSKGDIEILGDSLYAMNITRGYKVTENFDLVDQVKNLLKDRKVKWTHVDAHTGVRKNEICDTYATIAMNLDDNQIHVKVLK